MQLKALELLGFKSFPERTVLRFVAGITAVVGPNGSGKSNISDALRWVMGEQSTRALRGGKMEDVIFSGTQTRKSLGFAEVTLTLDNEDGALPGAGSELNITRRYYRSGDSEYYINRRLCRLRDINELFMDTGLGQEGYSLIGQGKIDEILSIKSTQRREVFEEAAGISRYRHRKEEAERKLTHTRENLLRITDKLEELDLQLAPLEQQAKEAKQYFKTREELRVLEVSLWMDRLVALRGEQSQLCIQYDAAQAAVQGAEAACEILYALTEELQRRAQEQESLLETARRAESAIDEVLARTSEQLSVLRVQRETGEEQLRRTDTQEKIRHQRAETLAKQERVHEEERFRLQAAVTIAEETCLTLDTALAHAKTDLQAAQTAQEALQLRGDQETQSAQRVASLLSALDASGQERAVRADSLRSALQESTKAMDDAVMRICKLQAEKERLSVCQVQQARAAEAAAAACVAATQQETSTQEAWVSLRMEENALSGRLHLLEDMERLYEGHGKAVKHVMERVQSGVLHGVHGPLAGLIEVPRVLTVAMEIALGGAMSHLVVDTQESAKAVLEDLKRCDGGRVTCLPLDAMRGSRLNTRDFVAVPGYLGLAAEQVRYDARYEAILSQLLGKVVLVSELAQGIAMARRFQHRFRIVTLDGQLIAPGGAMTGGSVNRRGGILSRATDLASLTEQQKVLQQRRLEAEAAAQAAKEARQSSEASATPLARAHKQTEHALLLAQTQWREQETRLQDLQSRHTRLEEEQLHLQERGTQAENQHRAAQEKRKGLEAARCRLHAERATAHADLQTTQEHYDTLQQTRREEQTKRAVLAAEMRAAATSWEIRQTALAELEAEQAEGAKERAHLGQNDLCICAAREEALRRQEHLQNRKIAAAEQLQALSAQRLEIETLRAKTERDSRAQNETLLHSQRAAVLLEQNKDTALQEETRLLEKLWEQYELSHEAARALAEAVEDKRTAQRRVEALRGQLRALGQVNLGAVEEYARVRERYDYLAEQKRDVEDSDRQLASIIDELTLQMQDIFKQEFQRIHLAFGETFRELFGGGTAELLLEDERDILGCGIEIRVQPPGKSLKTLSLLSGGEKAFVAIALYFAMLKIRPTPFCVLDEIEAALDDVNVLRFARYLRSMALHTQFIVITHRRGTMEEADLLYGVTMEQQGVSRMLSLNLNEAEERFLSTAVR